MSSARNRLPAYPFPTCAGIRFRRFQAVFNGGGVPWRLASAKGELKVDGSLEIKVKGLVVAASGVNPVADFRGVVNCLTPASPTTGVTLVSDPAPATSAGDARIKADLALPTPCIAPIVFVTNGTGPPPAPGSRLPGPARSPEDTRGGRRLAPPSRPSPGKTFRAATSARTFERRLREAQKVST